MTIVKCEEQFKPSQNVLSQIKEVKARFLEFSSNLLTEYDKKELFWSTSGIPKTSCVRVYVGIIGIPIEH